jgi:D-alanyl-D-alanine carboxypeptidase (penicillin-binding protein 5/6)
MLTHAPRPILRLTRRGFLLALVSWAGIFCGLMLPAHGSNFIFRDYGPHSRITPPDEIVARAALLVEGSTGRVLYARNPDERLLPASTTKLMTALIVYQKIGLNGSVRIVEDDTRVEPSSVPLIPGEVVSVNKLFHALLIESANDSARALGRYVAGSTDAFVDMMNQRALSMGLFNTHFFNPNGLPAPAGTHYTSCADLMHIFRAVISYPELREICSTKEYRLTTEARTQTLRNHNLLLGVYPGMGPAKTGWTEASKHTYAASVTRDGRELLLTLLDSTNKWKDAEILFNWGFSQPPAVAAAGGPPTFPAPNVRPAPTGAAPSTTVSLQPQVPADNAYQNGNR